MGHQLGKLTERVCKKRGTKRQVVYRINRPDLTQASL
jgi:hypothetical protein